MSLRVERLSISGVGLPVMVGDGAMATQLQLLGLPPGVPPECWNLDRPDAVRDVHAGYAAVGVDWIVTNTFGGSRPRLKVFRLDHRVEAVNARAVRLAREGAPDLPVLGSVGPTGSGDPASWEAAYREQCGLLAAEGIDGFMVETVVSLGEGAVAVRAAAEWGLPVFASFTPGADGCLLDGTLPEEAAKAFVAAGARVVGVNCGAGPASLLEPAARLVRAGLAPVLAAPNAGLPEWREGRACYSLPPDAFALAAIQFQDAGVRLLAGCCGTTPDHLRAVAALRHSTG